MAIKKYTNGSWVPASYRKYGAETDIITTLPATIIGDGTPISSYTIKGNMEQTGTPTPENPIIPEGVGERTENLFSGKGKIQNMGAASVKQFVESNMQISPGETYCINASSTLYPRLAFYMNNSRVAFSNWVSAQSSITIPDNCNNMYVEVRNYAYDAVTDEQLATATEIMLTAGSTAPTSYIPYGYKLPLTLGSTTTNIYLGEVQSTRMIKKLVLTGEETWSYLSSNAQFKLNLTEGIRLPLPTSIYWICSHYEAVSNSASWPSYDSCISWSNIDGSSGLRFRDIRYSNLDDFKTYIAQQYANGTPVTIWYVLEEPKIDIVDEPIRKIADYVDSVSGAGLATSGTAQEFDVGTALKPSELDLTYHGWHEHEDTKFTT